MRKPNRGTTLQFDAIVFDFDGVLVESVDVKTRAFAALYAEFGPEIERQVIVHHLANGGISRHVKFKHYHENLLGLEYTETIGKTLSAKFSRLVVDAIVAAPFVAGAQVFLENFHRRLPLFIASGTPNGELREIVHRRGMQQYFESIHGTPATKGEIIKDIVRSKVLAPARVLMVGDALADLDGAREAGTAFVGRITEQHGSPFPEYVRTIFDLTMLAAEI